MEWRAVAPLGIEIVEAVVWVLLWLIACSGPPSVEGVDPSTVRLGDRLTVRGSALAPDAQVRLVRGEQTIDLPTTATAGGLSATVPASLPIGRWNVVVVSGGAEVSAAEPVIVEEPPEEACTDAMVSSWSLALARQELVLDRFPRDGDPETVRLPLAQLVRVELDRLRLADGERCSAIYVRLTDGRRRLVQDERRGDLLVRAERLAADMGKPIEVGADTDAAASGE